MTDNSDKPVLAGGTLRSLFPGYYQPDGAQLRAFLVDGMVVLDTNALLDIYRMYGEAREEFLDVLRLLGDRLWVPHQVGLEFMENRADVIAACAAVGFTEMTKAADALEAKVRQFCKVRGLPAAARDSAADSVAKLIGNIEREIAEVHSFGVEKGAEHADDPIFQVIAALIDGKIGLPLDEAASKAAAEEGSRRIKAKVPPGYMDAKKPNPLGDYLLWTQTIREATARKVPVLLVSGDEKEDWVREEHGQKKGPRPELVLEMQDKTEQPFHLMTVSTFLRHARTHLSATVSDATVEQAKTMHVSFSVGPMLDALDIAISEIGKEAETLTGHQRLRVQAAYLQLLEMSDVLDDYDEVGAAPILRDRLAALTAVLPELWRPPTT